MDKQELMPGDLVEDDYPYDVDNNSLAIVISTVTFELENKQYTPYPCVYILKEGRLGLEGVMYVKKVQ